MPNPLRPLLLAAAKSAQFKKIVVALPMTRKVVNRFVSGETMDDCVKALKDLSVRGIYSTVDYLGENTKSVSDAEAAKTACLALVARLKDEGLTQWTEVSIKLTSLGLDLPDGSDIAYDNARQICDAVAEAGTTLTVDMEDHTSTDKTLAVVDRLRETYPWVGTVLQAALHRTVSDAERYAGPGSRIRLCKGAYLEPPEVAFQGRAEVDAAYRRALKVLMNGEGRPMVASHDPRMIQAATETALRAGRSADSFEFQMLYGIRADEQQRLADAGYKMTVYVPYGTDWWGYFIRRLAERPANLLFFLRALFGN
ncbi:MAG: proline dehydrogenase family protein [Propionibacteriaceae bacterium]|jgi:proline dehydrogenase|nr:proline dehydrogenase family protein [Propionibacteriaceae bacterium]